MQWVSCCVLFVTHNATISSAACFFFLFSCPLFPYYLLCEWAVRAAVCVHLLFHHTVACRNHAAPALLSCNQPPFRLPGAHGSQCAFSLSDLSYLCLLDSRNYLTHSTYVLLGDTECIRNCGMDAIHCVSLSCHVRRFKTGVSEVTYILVTRQILCHFTTNDIHS